MTQREWKNFLEIKSVLDKYIIPLLDFAYENKDIFIIAPSKEYINCFSEIQVYVDYGDHYGYQVYNYHNKIIKDYLKFCYKKLIYKNDEEFIDEFINLTNKINLIIYYLQRLFTYLDRFFTPAKTKLSLCTTSIRQYKVEFFLPFEKKLYEKLNKLIRDDRNGHLESRDKIKKILEIINYLDFSGAKIKKEKEKINILLQELNKDEALKKQEWFENYFMKETIQYLEEKSKNDIKNLSINDYIDTQLNYLKEEDERKQLYIYPQFHERLDNLNYLYLIGNNSKELLNKSIENSFNNDKLNKNELKKIYQFLKLFPKSIKDIFQVFKQYINEKFEVIFQKNNLIENPQKIIDEINEYKEKLYLINDECFDNSIKKDINILIKDYLMKKQTEENIQKINDIANILDI